MNFLENHRAEGPEGPEPDRHRAPYSGHDILRRRGFDSTISFARGTRVSVSAR